MASASHQPAVSGTLGGVVLVAAILSPRSALANDANVVLYNQHTEEKGETEIEVFSDFANVGSGEPNYTAQLDHTTELGADAALVLRYGQAPLIGADGKTTGALFVGVAK
jgi:hypothetical protein